MFEAAAKAFFQIFTAPFRRVLLKSIGLAFLLLVVIGIMLHRAVAAIAAYGVNAATGVDWSTQWGWNFLIWFLSFAAGLGIFAGAVFLMPAITALVGSFFVDEVAEVVEQKYYPNDLPGHAPPFWRALIEGSNTALLAIAVYICAAPFMIFAGFGFLIMFLANAYLLGREYFLLAAMRFRPPEEAKALRRIHRTSIFLNGLVIAMFVAVPLLNLAAPLFATAFMVHMHKRLTGRMSLMPPALPAITPPA
jgi:CysZ protein